jgi:hypothetical protein
MVLIENSQSRPGMFRQEQQPLPRLDEGTDVSTLKNLTSDNGASRASLIIVVISIKITHSI